ncbi:MULTISPECIES: PmeII family type II restriction endonuclease [unclassified Microcoleus]|uniref:PmeII family type II restriction endonuclease n=1 Tax=unclassified Microcoleus TaxID=2642155 RepID=UPI002FD57610
MSEQLHELLAFVLEKEVGLPARKSRSFAGHFAELEEFFNLQAETLRNGISSISGKRALRFTPDEIERILAFISSGQLSLQLTMAENFLASICRDFTGRQLVMVENLTLGKIHPNPFLIRALNLDTPEEVVRLNVYMTATRYIVTSMGLFIQKLLISCSESAEIPPEESGWDAIKTTSDGEKCWIQVKSGPNDMDKDQIVYWAAKIEEKMQEGDRAYIGIAYGKRTNKTVTLGLLKQILPNSEMITLIGRELWDFVSEDTRYTVNLFEVLRQSASQVLAQSSIDEAIERCSDRIIAEFIGKYGEGSQGVFNYIADIF